MRRQDILVEDERRATEARESRDKARKEENHKLQKIWIDIHTRFSEMFIGRIKLGTGQTPWTPTPYNSDGANAPSQIVLDEDAAQSVLLYISELKDRLFEARSDIEALEDRVIDLENEVHYLEP